MTLQETIYSIMANKKMKQSLVAQAAGYDPKTFNAMLRKRKVIKPEDILRICKALEVSPNDLFGWGRKKLERRKGNAPLYYAVSGER